MRNGYTGIERRKSRLTDEEFQSSKEKEIVVDEQIIRHGMRLDNLETAIKEIRDAVKIIAENSSLVAKLETHHEETRDALERAFKEISNNRLDYEASCEKVDMRLRNVELQMPILKLTSRWIIAGVICVVGAAFSTFALAVWALLPLIVK